MQCPCCDFSDMNRGSTSTTKIPEEATQKINGSHSPFSGIHIWTWIKSSMAKKSPNMLGMSILAPCFLWISIRWSLAPGSPDHGRCNTVVGWKTTTTGRNSTSSIPWVARPVKDTVGQNPLKKLTWQKFLWIAVSVHHSNRWSCDSTFGANKCPAGRHWNEGKKIMYCAYIYVYIHMIYVLEYHKSVRQNEGRTGWRKLLQFTQNVLL